MIFPAIEDYILFIGGIIDVTGKSNFKFWPEPILQLANYDVGFITSVCDQIQNHKAMSDRQSALAIKLIEKYERQLRKHKVEIPNHTHHRLGIREIVRANKIYLNDDNVICLKFPYNEEMIGSIKGCMKESQGTVLWSPGEKEWRFALTEYNLSWAYTFAKAHRMEVDPGVDELFTLIREAEQTPYKIELRVQDGKCEITNAPTSMLEYLARYIDNSDMYSLFDNAGILGYTIDPAITEQLTFAHGENFVKLCSSREIDHGVSNSIDDVITWAKTVNRSPIVVYNPHFTRIDLAAYERHFETHEIMNITLRDQTEEPIGLDSGIKLYYTNKILPNWQGRIPLLIAYANLMHGASKRGFLSKADKIVYHCETLPKR